MVVFCHRNEAHDSAVGFSKKPARVRVGEAFKLLGVGLRAVIRHGSGFVCVNATETRLTAGLRGSDLPRGQTNRGRELMSRKVRDRPGGVNGIFTPAAAGAFGGENADGGLRAFLFPNDLSITPPPP